MASSRSIRALSLDALQVVLLFAGLYLLRSYNYLFFHMVAEIISITFALAVFLTAWTARRRDRNGFFLIMGIGCLFAAALDTLHTLAYKGMGVFAPDDANLPTQLWIAARYLQAASLTAAPLFAGRAVRPGAAFGVTAAAAAALAGAIFLGRFPDCFVEGAGLTPFKVYSEYAIAIVLLADIGLLLGEREHFEYGVLSLIAGSITVLAISEVSFTLYDRDVYGFYNLLGHYLKIVSFFLAHRAFARTNAIRERSEGVS